MEIRRNAGFTIIELVVVIVVIGILAAVALPRFLSLQDRAHDAVVEGTQAALASGVIMAQSVWLAEGRDSALDNILDKDFKNTCVGGSTDTDGNPFCPLIASAKLPASLDANGKGFPTGHTQDNPAAAPGIATNPNAADTAEDCTEVFEFLMSDSSVKAVDLTTFSPSTASEAADSGFDFVAAVIGNWAPTTTATEGCDFAYLPDIADNKSTGGGAFGVPRTIRYNAQTGKVTVHNLSDSGTTSD